MADAWNKCKSALAEMRALLDELEEYSGVYEETAALRRQVKRIETACARCRAKKPSEGAAPDGGGDPRSTARRLIARLPLDEVFQNQALADAFLSELLLALARESSHENRRELQRQGIEKAKAQGVRFGAPSRPLPENFEEAHRAWRGGQLSVKDAAALCGMAKTTFYDAVRRAEKAAPEADGGGRDAGKARRPQRRLERENGKSTAI